MTNPFAVVKEFEQAVAEYCGAPYCVSVNSCTNALFLALKYQKLEHDVDYVSIPKHTYISVPMQIIHAGYGIKFRNEDWKGAYKLVPFKIYDSARRFTSSMYKTFREDCTFGESFTYVCVSFHWSKILGIQQGGAILHNNPNFDEWARRARFDGRTEGIAPKNDNIQELGWHFYMSPEIAAEGLVRLHHLPKHNPDLKNDDYPDLSQMSIFK